MAWPRPSKDEYLASFRASTWAERRGESSVWYLMSRSAAQRIHEFNSRAQIIVMLRNPVDMLQSLHSQAVLSHSEDILDFETALAAEGDRRRGVRIPANCTFPASLLYRETVRFKEQLERYFAVFGREQVHVLLFDDFVADTLKAHQGVLEFLGLDNAFAPHVRVVNPNKRFRSRWVHKQLWNLWDPRSPVRRIGHRLVPTRTVRGALWGVVTSGIPSRRRGCRWILRSSSLWRTELRGGIQELEAFRPAYPDALVSGPLHVRHISFG